MNKFFAHATESGAAFKRWRQYMHLQGVIQKAQDPHRYHILKIASNYKHMRWVREHVEEEVQAAYRTLVRINQEA